MAAALWKDDPAAGQIIRQALRAKFDELMTR
jgi:hypothetical protein